MTVVLDGYIIDDDMYEELSQRRWKPDKEGYGCASYGKGVKLKMHRIIIQAPEGSIVDHINGNVKDNRRENLRFVNAYQNGCNRKSQKDSTSQYKGVFYTVMKRGKYEYPRWIVKVKKHAKIVYYKTFKDELEAAKAYDEAALKYHGEYARLNFPPNL